jgi:hypothetical protein
MLAQMELLRPNRMEGDFYSPDMWVLDVIEVVRNPKLY